MSHTTTIKNLAITDIGVLRQAVQSLQEQGIRCELVENVKPRMYYNDQHGVCPYVLKMAGSQYDVGFELQGDGSYAAVMDVHGGYIQKALKGTSTNPLGGLIQEYGKHAAINAAVMQGYNVESCAYDEQGNLQLVLVG